MAMRLPMSRSSIRAMLVAVATAALSACVSTPGPQVAGSGTCRDASLGWAVGQPADEATLRKLSSESGAGLINPISPTTVVKHDSRSDRLREDPRLGKLILIGHSEGALIASLAAPQSDAAALISIAGSGRPIGDVLREQLQGRLPPALLATSHFLIDELEAGRSHADIPEPLQVLFRPSVQPYLISLFAQDPAAAIAAVEVPTLIVQGTHDIQVGARDAQALKRAKPDAELALIESMNHVLRIVPATGHQQLASYDAPQLPIADALLQGITRFLERNGILPVSSPSATGR